MHGGLGEEAYVGKGLRFLTPIKVFSLRAVNLLEGLRKAGSRISMDGKGRALDNVFVERLWRSVKYEEIYPKGYESMKEVRQGLKKYFEFYNKKRPHQGLEYRTPAEVYFGNRSTRRATPHSGKRLGRGVAPRTPAKG